MQSKPVNGPRKIKLSHTARSNSASINRAAIVAVQENVRQSPDVRGAEPDRPARSCSAGPLIAMRPTGNRAAAPEHGRRWARASISAGVPVIAHNWLGIRLIC
jgi:hypothetical protein